MKDFINKILIVLNSNKCISLDYEVDINQKIYINELFISRKNNIFFLTFSIFDKRYEEAVDLYDIYEHREFLSIEEMAAYLETCTTINISVFNNLITNKYRFLRKKDKPT